MSTPPGAPRRPLFVDLTPLRASPAFARLFVGNTVSGIGTQLTVVAVGLEVYDITRSTFAVALVGVFSLVPMIVAGLYGGMLADAFDRRKVALVAAVFAWLSTAAIALHAWLGVREVALLYLLACVNAVAGTMIATSRAAIVPRLLPTRLLPAAAALGGIGTGLMLTVGPALAGVLVAGVGFPLTYSVDVVLFSFAFVGILTLPPIRPEGETSRPGLSSLAQGLRFLRSSPNIRTTFVVDLIAMTFGQPRVLYPVVGTLVIGGGAVTVGALTASYAVGSLLSSVFSGRLGQVRLQGRAVNRSIAVYGAFIAAFGVVLALTPMRAGGALGDGLADARPVALVAAAIALAGAGAADNVSSIFRSTILQAAAPDSMRGRLQGIFIVVVTGGPRLGDLFVGLVAAVGVAWPPLLGGALVVVLLGVVARLTPSFRRYDATAPTP
ncbi:MFS transporter [Frigoribacterium sp. CFBP9039]|uniref:MFS transporter n=1 Tax=Frigoribacterium TaxID=96492 RepID=UPI001FAD4E79|nr:MULTISPECIES: MFS transporter [Frigoribacterium]MCJ0699982.1 MFS transporter [Frigoribacterium faeni]MDY0946487.1 MFS transporter [Frigoribacterium sp. CFBP9039]